MKIGIPRALLYYKYSYLWETFFEELGIEYIVSPDTNKEIINKGMTYAIDEACLSSKIYLGHVEWLIDKCDYILVPRVSNYGSAGTVCTKFQAIYDIVKNTFRDRNINILYYNIDVKSADFEVRAFLKMGKVLNKRKSQCMRAYLIAKQAEKTAKIMDEKYQEQLLNENKIKILLIAHHYNINDKYIGAPIIDYIRDTGAVPIIGDIANKKEAIEKSYEITETLPWEYNKELIGSIAMYKDRVDGIILISSFNCGPDSLVNEIIIRRVKDKPILNLIVDGQEGSAGMETRLESFLDIIKFKKDDYSGII
ncbi:acyl-CoA dehydratase activase-related protein [Proteiniborus sp. MB09-C3]|nr:acyl-CoA dehydratase activase-related protein [Proteiniborus sp. MB09-C3]WIV11631.1 acyl-CoA dehydratase activase-related protein [Proteiniborus sp. MB09-C3]